VNTAANIVVSTNVNHEAYLGMRKLCFKLPPELHWLCKVHGDIKAREGVYKLANPEVSLHTIRSFIEGKLAELHDLIEANRDDIQTCLNEIDYAGFEGNNYNKTCFYI